MDPVRVALVDNHDSYTYNLHQLLWEITGREPHVVRNDEVTVDELLALEPTHVVVSPGPGSPHDPRDFGICAELIDRVRVPCLGVCLGHQGVAAAFGARVVPAATVMHGRRSLIRHTGTGLFAGIPQEFPAVRYHSLVVEPPLHPDLVETAWADDGALMGLAHRHRPLYGVQFHPESIETAFGARLLGNFLAADRSRRRVPGRAVPPTPVPAPRCDPDRRADSEPPATARVLLVRWRRVGRAVPPDRVFTALFAGEDHAFWLDSARRAHGLGRHSFMGSAAPERGPVLRAYAAAGVVEEHATTVTRHHADVFDHLRRCTTGLVTHRGSYPLPFAGGLVGYLGHGAKAALRGGAPRAGGGRDGGAVPGGPAGAAPDAEFVWADRLVAFDHDTGEVYAVTLGLDADEADRWLDLTCAAIGALPTTGVPVPAHAQEAGHALRDVRASVDRVTYGEHFRRIQGWLRRGETYEACYTYRIGARCDGDPLAAYLRLRRENPAPYGAYLRFGDRHVLGSSPERFVTVGADGWAETRPIKGTAARHPDPRLDRRVAAELAADQKNRSENLMIVDLLRNDLGRVCLPGTVRVPALMAVESYATVHHLVTTVRGRLRAGVGAVDAVAALFPVGSMTGAPKERTVELLDDLETTPRGVYSGCLGYLGPDGAADLAVVNRTIVWEGDRLTVGVGGAITVLSDPDEEYAEAELKAAAVLGALTGERSVDRAAGLVAEGTGA